MATITVGVNSYVTEAELDTFALDRGITITGDKSILLIKAMDYLETRRFSGTKYDSDQELQFPRDTSTVPNDIKKAQMIASILIGQGNDLQPVIGRATKSERVGELEVVYQDGASMNVSYQSLTDILGAYLITSTRLVRG